MQLTVILVLPHLHFFANKLGSQPLPLPQNDSKNFKFLHAMNEKQLCALKILLKAFLYTWGKYFFKLKQKLAVQSIRFTHLDTVPRSPKWKLKISAGALTNPSASFSSFSLQCVCKLIFTNLTATELLSGYGRLQVRYTPKMFECARRIDDPYQTR